MADATLGQVSFLEIGSRDGAATRAFFGAVFNGPRHVEAWFQTPRIRAAGGEAQAPTNGPGFGRFVQCVDPGGVRFGLHQASG